MKAIEFAKDDDYAYACECGSVKFNLLKSGKVECVKCGARTENPTKHVRRE